MYLDEMNQLAETAATLGLKAPAQIVFGHGSLKQAGELARNRCRPEGGGGLALVCCSGSVHQATALETLESALRTAGFKPVRLSGLHGEPEPETVNNAVQTARRIQPVLLAALGGGSVIDTAKAVAALTVNDGAVEEYLEAIGTGRTLTKPPLPLLAIPTTAGTGAEMTKNAVLVSYTGGWKKSFRDDRMIPRAVILDPDLTLTVPPDVTAWTGMDALTQLLESTISARRTPAVSALAAEALRGTPEALETLLDRPDDRPARAQMLKASTISGLCLANAGLGMAHGIAAALGALHHLPHGLACGRLLPPVMRYNATAACAEMQEAFTALLNEASPNHTTLERGFLRLEDLNRKAGIPNGLTGLKLTEEELTTLAEASMGGSMSGNPQPMTPATVLAFLKIYP